MSDISIFKEMINSAAIVPLIQENNKNIVILNEPAASYSLSVYGMPDDDQTIVIKADAFTAPLSIFANSKHECKRADFVIIADAEDKKVIVCLEMKAGKGGSESEIVQQLKGAKCFVGYCREIGQLFWNYPNFLKDYEFRFVSIRNISIAKRPTRNVNRTIIHDAPDRMLKISSPKGLQFNRLINA